MEFQRIALIGYGEVGRIFCAGLKTKPGVQQVLAWDLKFDHPGLQQAQQHAATEGVKAAASMQDLCECADGAGALLISAVTASNTLPAAEDAARYIKPGAVYLDLNSASPDIKRQSAAFIEAAGGHYVEAGVMTSVPPYGIRVPMLLGGKMAAQVAGALCAWNMDAKAVSERLGIASAIKMSRSVMIKGLEALVIESYTKARALGVEAHMLPTLAETFPGIDWERQGAYFFSRVVQHGKRRAEEMRESARTGEEAGFEPFMARAIADKQQWVADQAANGVFEGIDLSKADWREYADRLISGCRG